MGSRRGGRLLAGATGGLLVVGLVAGTGGPAVAEAAFGPSVSQPLNAMGRDVALGDVNGDGVPDQVVSFPPTLFYGPGVAAVAVLLGDGAGGFAAPVRYPTPAPGYVAAGDLDGDGDDDVVLATQKTFKVWVLRAENGRLAVPRAFSAGTTGMSAVEIADVDGHGTLDVVVATDQAATVGVLLGTGDGRLGPVTTSPTGGPTEGRIGVGDVDGDGRPDVVTADYRGESLWFLAGRGDGGFAAPLKAMYRQQAGGVRLADLDGDGRLDVVSPRTDYSTSVAVARGDGTGRFGPPRLVAQGYDGVFSVIDVAVDDLDEDNRPDLFVVTSSAGDNDRSGYVLYNRGALNLTAPQAVASAAGEAVWAGTTGDLDRDGDTDLVLVGDQSTVVLSTGPVVPAPRPVAFADATPTATGVNFADLAVGDLDGDDHLDVLASARGTGTVLLGDGTGRLQQRARHAQVAGPMRLADLDGDGDLDVVALGYDNLQSLRNNGSGRFTPAWSLAGPSDDGRLADLDGDGRPDLLTASYVPGIQIRVGLGDGSFAATPSILFPDIVAGGLAVADLDADGALDVAVNDVANFRIVIRYGDGKGGFPREQRVATTPEFRADGLDLVDLDDDGDLDLLTRGSSLLSNGNGGFARAQPSGPILDVRALADVDGDGLPDRAVTVGDRAAVSVGLGDGTFAPAVVVNDVVEIGSYQDSLLAGDFDEDGRPDLTFTEGYAAVVWVALNRTTTSPVDLLVTQVAVERTQVAAGGTARVTDTVFNTGDTPAAATSNSYVLSRSSGAPTDPVTLGGTRTVPALPGGVYHRGSSTVTVPAGTPAGLYWLYACADRGGTVAEADEDNNCGRAPISLLVGAGGPDLVVESSPRPPATVTAGGPLSLAPTIRNLGTGAAGPSVTRAYLSADTTVGNDRPLVGGDRVGVLEPGYGRYTSIPLTVDAATPPGVYYVVVCADGDAQVVEQHEDNNCRIATTTTTVTAP